MEKLKKQIIKYFLLCSFGIALLESMLDSLYDDRLFPIAKDSTQLMSILLVSYGFFTVFIFAVFAAIFYKLADSKIKEETARQLEEKNHLYANIAHDLKTPITSIVGFASALKNGKLSIEENVNAIDIIYTKAKRTDKLINELFSYSKLESNAYELCLKKQDVCAVVRALLAEAYQEFEDRNMELKIDIPDTPIYCMIDKIEFERAINNLIENAYKHNRPKIQVYIAVQEFENMVRIIVADTGNAIDTAIAQTIFEPFICGDDSRNSSGGSGLGLAISRKAIEKQKGKLYLSTEISGYAKGFIVEIGICRWK